MLLERQSRAFWSHAMTIPPEPCPRERSLEAETRRHASPARCASSPRPLALKVSEKGASLSRALAASPSRSIAARWSGSSIPPHHSSFITTNSALLATSPDLWHLHTTTSLPEALILRGGAKIFVSARGRSMLRRSNILFGFRAIGK